MACDSFRGVAYVLRNWFILYERPCILSYEIFEVLVLVTMMNKPVALLLTVGLLIHSEDGDSMFLRNVGPIRIFVKADHTLVVCCQPQLSRHVRTIRRSVYLAEMLQLIHLSSWSHRRRLGRVCRRKTERNLHLLEGTCIQDTVSQG
jgi:hypothetical protein